MRYQEDGQVHLDFHGATHTTIDYIVEHHGVEALHDILYKVGKEVYRDIRLKLQSGDTSDLQQHWQHFFDRENGDYHIEADHEEIRLVVKSCPAVAHVKKLGLEPGPHFCDQTEHVNRGMTDGTPYTLQTRLTGTGSCIQTLRKIP